MSHRIRQRMNQRENINDEIHRVFEEIYLVEQHRPTFDDLSVLEILEEKKHISSSSVKRLKAYMNQWRCSGFQAVLEAHLMTEHDLASCLAQSVKLDRIFELEHEWIQRDEVKEVLFERFFIFFGYELSKTWECVPTGLTRDHENQKWKWEFAWADPTQSRKMYVLKDVIQRMFPESSDEDITWVVSEKSAIQAYIDEIYPLEFQWPQLSTFLKG